MIFSVVGSQEGLTWSDIVTSAIAFIGRAFAESFLCIFENYVKWLSVSLVGVVVCLLQVVVDFYNAACGSCKYILPQFVKMCKSGGQGAGGMGGVVFVKHDVRDEYDELTVSHSKHEGGFCD